MKITKKQLDRLVESIVAEMCDEELSENVDSGSALEMVQDAAEARMPSALKAAMEQLANEQPHAYKSLFKIARMAIENPINKSVWAKVAEKAMKLRGLNESELSPDPEWESMTSPAMRQHYPGSFEQDGQRSDLQEGTNIRWDNALYKAAISANKTEELVGDLMSHSNGLNEDQLFKLKKIHEKAAQLAKLVELMKNWT